MTSQEKSRLDILLVERNAFESRARARAAIEAGLISVDGAPILKPAALVAPDAAVAVTGDVHDYVSRGGVKLEAALDAFNVDPSGAVCLDLGASTGGFTDALLRREAKKVFAVDVGAGQLHARLAHDPRVVSLEKTHARDISSELIPEAVDLIVADVSFISLKKALPSALALGRPGARLIALVKPQFEAGRAAIGKGGIVRPGRENAEGVAEDLLQWLEVEGVWRSKGLIESPIKGGDGNREFLIGAERT
jgi:23S rRNA (cytidine1920-2'-O)/16S rRNA (cytidine1409-2'-O)-methyltransferase